ncbi:hypothetical protein AB3329_01745 [Streptococcus sp. H31]|uniref:hypothetical protein n=1 Tax=Streptococcus huangxiaojuni TaxID=3237239 RepID=UPI0034A16354
MKRDDFEKVMLDGIYGWSVDGGKINPPKHNFPVKVKERIDYFAEMMEEGLTLMGALSCIFGEEAPDGYGVFASKDWLPKDDEFKEWHTSALGFPQMEVAVYLIYG